MQINIVERLVQAIDSLETSIYDARLRLEENPKASEYSFNQRFNAYDEMVAKQRELISILTGCIEKNDAEGVRLTIQRINSYSQFIAQDTKDLISKIQSNNFDVNENEIN